MANPRLLLLDEMSLGLAPIVVKGLYAGRAGDRGGWDDRSCIVEQDVGQALRIADRAYCLLEGRISLQGKATELNRDAIRTAYFGVLDDGLGERDRPGGPAGRAVRLVRDRPVAHLRRDAGREPGARRPDDARRVRRARRHATHATSARSSRCPSSSR